MAVGAVADPWTGGDVGKKRKPGDPAPKLKMFAVRLPPDLSERVEDTASGLSLDSASLLRMMIRETLMIYERRAERIRSGLPPE